MTPEQKQRSLQLIADWSVVTKAVTPAATYFKGEQMSALLQEIANALEPDPVMWKIFGDGWSEETSLREVAESYGSDGNTVVAYYIAPPHQSEHHLEMVNTPAPSVPPVRSTGQWESSRIADYNRGWNDCREATEKALNDLEKRK